MNRAKSIPPISNIQMIASLVFFCLLISACNLQPTPARTTTPAPKSTATLYPTSTPTPLPPGIENNPLILAFVAEPGDQKISTAAEAIVAQLIRLTGFSIQARYYQTYSSLLADLVTAKAHIAFLPALTYLYASQGGTARAELIANHGGVYNYGALFLANAASKFTLYFDPTSNRSTVDAATALKQFQDKRPCWLDSQSPAGYALPLGLLADKGINIKEGAYFPTPAAMVRALYITGICDFGVTYSNFGDPRTAATVKQDLTDVMNRVVILWQSDPFIPNLNLTFSTALRREMKEDLVFAFQDLSQNQNGKTLLSTAAAYEILDLKPVSDNTYDPLRNLVNKAKLDLVPFIGR